MDFEPADGRDPDEPGVVVVLTPRDYRRRAAVLIVVGLVVVSVSLVVAIRDDGPSLSTIYGLVALGYGVHCLRRARQNVSQLVTRIDREGIWSGADGRQRRWGGVVMVWVGSQTGLRLPVVAQPVLSVYTVSGSSFAERAGVRPSPLYTIAIGGRHDVPELCRRLREVCPAQVVDGTSVSRRTAAAALAGTAPRA